MSDWTGLPGQQLGVISRNNKIGPSGVFKAHARTRLVADVSLP
jgi:hypothetical protein